MPAFLTHYACGVLQARRLPSSVTESCISAHRNVYATALAGPDIFFYSVLELLRPGMTIGRRMHKYRTGEFLRNLYTYAVSLRGEQRDIAIAYFTGFLGHYCLDANTHPLVYRKAYDPSESKALGKHFRYEAAMDAYCCRTFLGRDIRRCGQMSMIRLTRMEKKVVAELLSHAVRKTYPELGKDPSPRRMYALLNEYFLITGLLIDPSGFREWAFLRLEKLIPGYPLLSPLFINGNLYGISEKDFLQFRRRFDRGGQMFARLLSAQEMALRDPACVPEFFRQIGNRSYHTGGEAEIMPQFPRDHKVNNGKQRETN